MMGPTPLQRVKRRMWPHLERQLVRRELISSDVATNVLRSRGRVPAWPVDVHELTALLRDLHPVAGDVPLIRIGPANDGGYLVPDDLAGVVACISPGVGPVSGFELDCVERGIDVFMVDGSVDGPATEHPRFHFTKKFLGNVDDDAATPPIATIDRWAADVLGDRDGDLLLQMDIEGGEWQVLPGMTDALLRRCRVIVVELHGLDGLFERAGFTHLAPILRRLLHTHACVHIHPNNCAPAVERLGVTVAPVAEFTFLRRDRVRQTGHATDFPHPLDSNNVDGPSVVLPESMFRSTKSS